ncbi:MAG: hypothetical protein QXH68_02160, partial [Candidatus Aenigmatarchaeota archaeon]
KLIIFIKILFIKQLLMNRLKEEECNFYYSNSWRQELNFLAPRIKSFELNFLAPRKILKRIKNFARQLVYKDKRANPLGRIPDDVWCFSRVCGTFKERIADHSCQMPETILERIIPGDIVLDPFGNWNYCYRC